MLAVYTGHDVKADGLGMPKANMPRKRPDGKPMFAPQRPPLVTDRVRYVGDPVVMVIAETLAQAKDAAELVEIDYEPLPSVTLTEDTVKPGAPVVWDDCPDNISNNVERGKKADTDEAIKNAAKVIKRRYVITRVHAQYMEPRGTLGTYDPGEDRLTLYADVQYPHRVRNMLAQNVAVAALCHQRDPIGARWPVFRDVKRETRLPAAAFDRALVRRVLPAAGNAGLLEHRRLHAAVADDVDHKGFGRRTDMERRRLACPVGEAVVHANLAALAIHAGIFIVMPADGEAPPLA